MFWLCSAGKQWQGHVDMCSNNPVFNFQIHKCQVEQEVEDVEVVPDPWISAMLENSYIEQSH